MKKLMMLIVVFVAMLNTASGKETYDLKQMRKYFKESIANGPYIYLQSPRTGLGVGTIYSVVKNQTLFFSRPNDCFTKEILGQAETDEMAVPEMNIAGKYSWELGLQVAASGPITEAVKAEFSKKRVSSMTLKIPYLKRDLITIRDLMEAINMHMDFTCKRAMTSTETENWIILEALHTDQFAIEFQDAIGTNVGVSAGILKILFPSFKCESQGEVTGSLKFSNQNHIVAIKAIKVAELPIEKSKSPANDIQFIDMQPDDYYQAIDKPE
jgi:hypothetical protein